MKGRILNPVAMLLVMVMTVGSGCMAQKDEAMPSSMPMEAPSQSTTEGFAGGEFAKKAEEAEADDAEENMAAGRRMVIREAHIELRVDHPAAIIAQTTALAEGVGGFVVNSQANGVGQDVTRVDVTLRVPEKRFESSLGKLRTLLTLLSGQISGQDGTEEVTDLSARLRAKRKLEERFLGLLAQAATVEDTLKIEHELSRVRVDLERMEGRKRYLKDRVSMSTIHVSAVAPYRPSEPDRESTSSILGRALSDAGSIIVEVCAGMIRVSAALLPVGIFFGCFGFGIYVLVRLVRRRRR